MIKNAYKRCYLKGAGEEIEIPAGPTPGPIDGLRMVDGWGRSHGETGLHSQAG